MDRRVKNLIALIISSVWAASFIADIFMSTYEPSPFIHAIMMVVVGAIFVSPTKKG